MSRPTRSFAQIREDSEKPSASGRVDILMVDDHRENLLALEGILQDPQYNLVSASSGREALKQLLDREFALILLDVMMPEMDGFETAELIRSRDQSRHTPIIFLTAIDQIQSSEVRGYAAGAVDFLFKPLNPGILRSKVRAFVDLYVKGRELHERVEVIRQRELTEHRRKLEQVQVQRDRFFSLSYDMMAVLDKDGIIREANLAWEKTLGIPAAELQGTPVRDLFQPQDQVQIQGALKSLEAGRGFVTLEACHRHRDGSLRWLSWTLLSFPNEPGGYIVARDVSERVRTGRQLEDFFENAPVGSHWIGPDGILLRANRAELDLLGYPLEEFVGRSIRDIHVDPESADLLLKRLQAGETIREHRSKVRCRDGSIKEVLIDANALIEEGRFIHSRGFLRDVTEQRQAERRQAITHEVTRILAESRDFSEAAPRLLKTIGASLDWEFGAAWRLDSAAFALRCVEVWESPPSPSPTFREATRKAVVTRGMGLPGQAWAWRKILWCPDLPAESHLIRREEAMKDGLKQGIVIPLMAGDEVLGVLEFYGRAERPPEEAMVSLATTLASQISQFIEGKVAEEALAERSRVMIHHQAALLEMAAWDAGDPESALRKLTESAARTLGIARAGLWFLDPQSKSLVCRDDFLAATGHHEQGERLEGDVLSEFIAAVQTSRVLIADQSAADPRIPRSSEDPFRVKAFTTVMNLPIRQRGALVAVLRLVHSGVARTWSPEEQDFASSMADRVAILLSDIERRRDEEEIRRLNTGLEARVRERTVQLTESLQEQEQFAYSVSHDLRAPLRAMSGFSQALFEDYSGGLDETGREYARRIMDAADRMDALIKDLLAYSRLSRAEIQLDKVDPQKLVEDVLHQLEVERLERQATVEVQGPLLSVRGNALTLTQVILNLVNNAFKFVAAGVPPKLRISTERRGSRVRIWFEDNGIGILPEHHDRIFRIFERLNRQELYPGTGIGLAMVRKAMSRMDGTCGVESDVRTGSRFWIELEKG